MGGPGSGRIFHWDTKTVLEECRFVDVRDWKRRGLLGGYGGFSWSWSQDGTVKASIYVWTGSDRVRLVYAFRRNGGARQDVDEIILLTSTPCHMGGERLWFLCPGCGRRAAKLYGYSPHFLCRSCCQLSYASQQETVLDRANRKARKLRRKLGDEDSIGDCIWEKPKGMHWRTFEALRAKVEKQDEIANSAFAWRAMKLIGWPSLA
jgi:hypothetical protein